jgi:hypothetical protein
MLFDDCFIIFLDDVVQFVLTILHCSNGFTMCLTCCFYNVFDDVYMLFNDLYHSFDDLYLCLTFFHNLF